MTYFDKLKEAAEELAKDQKVIFVGQAVAYPGTAVTKQLKDIPKEQLLELPVAEDFQAGFCIGLALEGFLPVSIYPRFNFAILACNQIFNHLDKWAAMSDGESNPKIITKVVVGSIHPLHPGFQHSSDYVHAMRDMATNIAVFNMVDTDMITPCYDWAHNKIPQSSILVEHGDMYNNE
jgi:pyruvate/2-oxoglutarate/acetoin dehydrogenase E1 component